MGKMKDVALEEIVDIEEAISDNGDRDNDIPEVLEDDYDALTIDRICRHGIPTAQEERELFRLYKNAKTNGSEELAKTYRDRILKNNQRLVRSIAKKYIGGRLPPADLFQEGNIGLMRAFDKFDLSKDYRFSTYATWWIHQAISRALSMEGEAVRWPAHAGIASYKIHKAIGAYKDKGKEPSIDDIAEVTGYKPNTVRAIRRCMYPVSLDMPVGEDENSTLGESVKDENVEPQTDYTAGSELRESLEEALKNLTPRERRVIDLRFGLTKGYSMTLEEVGEIMGCTRENVRLIQNKTLRKLRHPSRGRILVGYLD